MDSTAVTTRVNHHLKNVNQASLSKLVTAVLVIYLLWFAANLTWKLIPQPDSALVSGFSASATNATQATVAIDIERIKQLNLFGELGKVEEKPIEQAVERLTKLNLTLSGVVATADPKSGAAIIENNGKQATYGINDKIDGTRAFLREIYPDRVILDQAGAREILMLEGIDYSRIPGSSRSGRVVPEPEMVNELSDEVVEARQEILENPGKITDYIRISPVRANGLLQGYRIMPGKSPELFSEAGLEANDLVTEINGYDLTQPANAMTAMNELRSAESVSLTITRDDEVISIDFSLPQ